MSFSRPQQRWYRDMVAAAWREHLREQNLPGPKTYDRAWYEKELEHATGHTTTADCNAGRDYDFAMAHFETLARTGDLKWQMKAHGGDANRILWHLKEITDAHGIDEHYLRAIAKRALRLEELPELIHLPRRNLIMILGEVKRFVRRREGRVGYQPASEGNLPEEIRAANPHSPGANRTPENCPF